MSQDRWHIPTTDEEIVGVFLEEVDELLASIDSHLKNWRNHPGDKKALTEIRRSFHTLKGSGRMVKAFDLAEVAWKIEKVLNQAIAGTVPMSEPLLRLVGTARAQLPRMVDAFKNRRSIAGIGDIESLMTLADDLAAGRPQAPAPLAATSSRDGQSDGPNELNLKLERCMQRADEALHRSEMALQQARSVSAQGEAANWGAGQRDCLAEVDRLGELVKLISKDVSDLHLESKKTQSELILRRSEVNRLVDERVRERLAPRMDRLRSEVERDIEENHRTLIANGRFGWLALILSALVGGLIATALFLSILRPG